MPPKTSTIPAVPSDPRAWSDADLQSEIKRGTRLAVQQINKMLEADETAATARITAARVACIIGGIMKPLDEEPPDPAEGRAGVRKELAEAMSRQEKMEK